MSVERRSGSLKGMPDDRLGTVAVALAVSELSLTPDVVPAVMDRISRDAVAYPEQFDRRPKPHRPRRMSAIEERSAGRALGRLAVIGILLAVVVAIVVFAASASARAASASDVSIDLVEVSGGWDQPVVVADAGDGSGDLYVVEQTGRIWSVDADGRRAQAPFLDLSDDIAIAYEQGLLGLAFHPAHAENGRFFVNYTRAPDGATVVSEFTAADGIVDRASERRLLVIEQPFANHNAGDLAFDASGMLLIPTGDGGSGGDPLGSGQDPRSLLGKLLRIDVDSGEEPYGIPADNGFADSEAHRPEIHAMGLRNPWRISIDPLGGHIYIGDVGQSSYEEISVAPRGRGGVSFGWNEVEGPACHIGGCDPSAHTPPALSYGRDEGCTVIGGHVYRGSEQPGLEGVYLFGDYCSGTIWGADAEALVAGDAARVPVGAIDGSLVSFGVDEAGEIYAVEHGGRILHVVTEAS